MALQDGFKVTALSLLYGGTDWGADTTGNLNMRGPGTSIEVGTGFTGTYGTDGSGVIDEVAITAAGKNYSSGSWTYDPIGSAITTTVNYSTTIHWNPSASVHPTAVLLSGVTNDTNNRIGVYDDDGFFQVLTYETSVSATPPHITGVQGWRPNPGFKTPQVTHGTSIYNVQAGTAIPGEFCSIGIRGTGHGAVILPTIGQDASISFYDIQDECTTQTAGAEEASLAELYGLFSSIAGEFHTDLEGKPNFDWFQGGPVSASAQNPIRLDEFYGSNYTQYGGVGCLGLGTPITMADGTTKNIEDVNVGDMIKSATVPAMPLDFDEEDTWSVWSGTPHGNPPSSVWATAYYDIQEINRVTPASASVQDIYFDYYDNYYLINDSLKVTYEHPFFVLRDGSYNFKTTVSLELGDKLFKTNNEFELIETIEFVNEPLETVNLNVEDLDVYFGGGYLMHNVYGKS